MVAGDNKNPLEVLMVAGDNKNPLEVLIDGPAGTRTRSLCLAKAALYL